MEFNKECRDCEQKQRNEIKNEDRPLAIIQRRAKERAGKVGDSWKSVGRSKSGFEFFMIEMNYRALVPVLRALLGPEGLCLGCGHKFDNERDVQIEHMHPPRNETDWARLHTRNLGFACTSCNGTKSDKPPAQWLDEQELARLSNLGPHQKGPQTDANWREPVQLDLLKF